MKSARYLNLPAARQVYQAGGNVTSYLRAELGIAQNDAEVIEIAYDLQAGSYAEFAEANTKHLEANAIEVAPIVNRHTRGSSSFLDVGTGELTTLTFLAARLERIERLLAFDLSWSRIRHGLQFASKWMPAETRAKTEVFVADIARIPLPACSVDVVLSNHALEPNGGNEEALLTELFRVARSKVILLEPSFENASAEARERMSRLGYVKNLVSTAERVGGALLELVAIENVDNVLNPTYAHVFDVTRRFAAAPDGVFADPGAETLLERRSDCFFSNHRGIAYPILQGIPLLQAGAGILASALDRFAAADP